MFEQRGADLRRRSTLRIVVIGCGAVGGYFGGRLAASGAEVTFVARGASLAALRSRSLQVESVNGDFLVSTVSPPSAEKAKECGVTVAMVEVRPNRDQLAEINRLLESGKLKVRVATVLPLTGVKKAHQLSASGHADGKIILRP
jgi:ketopantoate reductase